MRTIFLEGPIGKGQGNKLEEGRFRLDIKIKSFAMRVVKHGNTLHKEMVDASSQETIKIRLDGDVSNQIKL